MKSPLLALLVVWLLVLGYRLVSGGQRDDVMGWTSYIVLLVLTVALILLVIFKVGTSIRKLAAEYSSGEEVVRSPTLIRLLVGGLIASLVIRVVSADEWGWASVAPVLTFTALLIATLFLRERRQSLAKETSTYKISVKYSLVVLSIVTLLLGAVVTDDLLSAIRSGVFWVSVVLLVVLLLHGRLSHRWQSEDRSRKSQVG